MRSPFCLELLSRKPSWPAFMCERYKQAGHMDASDLIKTLHNTLQGGGRPHMENLPGAACRDCGSATVNALSKVGRCRGAIMEGGMLAPDESLETLPGKTI